MNKKELIKMLQDVITEIESKKTEDGTLEWNWAKRVNKVVDVKEKLEKDGYKDKMEVFWALIDCSLNQTTEIAGMVKERGING